MSIPREDERKTIPKTFRFTASLARSLEKAAAVEGTNVNAYANAVISRHFEWDRKAREFGFVELPKSLLVDLLEGCDDETLVRIGRKVGSNTWRELAEFWTGDSSPKGILDHLTFRSKFNYSARARMVREEDAYTVVIYHDFGPKWSILARSALEELVKKSFLATPRISVGESVVMASFKVNPRTSSPVVEET